MIKLTNSSSCTGCTACASACPQNCISMVEDKDGFPCPQIDSQKCISCGLCEKICPVLHPLKLTGNLPQAYAAYSRDEMMRLESSSGGIFSELARVVLKNGGAVFGAAYNSEFKVLHICIEKEADLEKLRGAKYAQSDLDGVFPEVKIRLDKGQEVLFSGTPCQIGGLKSFLRKEYENLLTVDFVCHSVPSPLAWSEYVKYRATHDYGGKLPKKINLRSKKNGWSRYQYSNLFEYDDDSVSMIKSGDSLYMKLFVGGLISRECCSNCRFKGYNRASDVTIGDFWGIWDVAPEMDDNRGTSVVLVQSGKGAELLRAVSEQLVLQTVTLDEASQQNGAILYPSQPDEMRVKVLKWIREGKIAQCEGLYSERRPTAIQRLSKVVKKLLHRGVKR